MGGVGRRYVTISFVDSGGWMDGTGRMGGVFMGRNRLTGRQIFPTHRLGGGRRVGPGVEMRADPVERRRRDGEELDMYTALE